MRCAQKRLPRLSRRQYSRLSFECLEPRVLLNGYTFILSDSGNDTTNGTNLKNAIYGKTLLSNSNGTVTNHVLSLGDTLILQAGTRTVGNVTSMINWDLGSGSLSLPNIGASANVTVNLDGTLSTTATPVITFTGGNFGNTTLAYVTFTGGGGSGATGTVTIYPNGVTGFVLVNNGSLYTAVPSVTFNNNGTGYTTSANATAVLTTYIDGIKITNSGANYDANTTVSFSGGTSGDNATGHVTLNANGTIKNVIVDTPGSGYTAAPTLVFADPGGNGTGATGWGGFGIDHFNISSTGAGYTIAPTVTISAPGNGGTTATANPIIDGAFGNITITNAGSGYTSAPAISLSTNGYGYTSAPTVSFDNTGTGGANAAATATIKGGIVTSCNITNPGSNYSTAPVITLSGGLGTGGVAATAYGIVRNGSLIGITLSPGTLTIQSATLRSLATGRIQAQNATQEGYLARITSSNGAGIISTTISDSYGHSGAAHDYAFLGIEICPSDATQNFTDNFLSIGDSTSAQFDVSQVPYNFTVDQCFIHGGGFKVTTIGNTTTSTYIGDDSGNFGGVAANSYLPTTYNCTAIGLNAFNVTVSNSYLSDMHSSGQESKDISGHNGLGTYTINNNFLEATAENYFQGGAPIWIPGTNIDNVTITHNYFYKRLAWDEFSPFFGGVTMIVKNLLEFKMGRFATIDSNLFENCWVEADQRGQAINLVPIGNLQNPWTGIANVTITNNVIKNVGVGITLVTNGQWAGYTNQPTHDILIRNNLFENIEAGTGGGGGTFISIGSNNRTEPGWNITIDHNTALSSSNFLSFSMSGNSTIYTGIVSSGFTFTNNVLNYGQYGLFSSQDTGVKAIEDFGPIANITNGGDGYTAAPTVTFNTNGTGGSFNNANSTPIALLNGHVVSLNLTNSGSGYTSAPIITVYQGNANHTVGGGGAGAIVIPNMISDGNGTYKIDPNNSFTVINGGLNYDGYNPIYVSFSNTLGNGGYSATATANISGPVAAIVTRYQNGNPDYGSGFTVAPTVTISAPGNGGITATAETFTAVTYANGTLPGNTTGGLSAAYFAGNVIISTPSSKMTSMPGSMGNATMQQYKNYYLCPTDNAAGFTDTPGENFALLSTIVDPSNANNTISNPIKGIASNNLNGSYDPGVNMANLNSIPDFAPLDSTLQGYWKFDDATSSPTAVDSSTYNHNGNLSSLTLRTTTSEMNNGITLTGGTSGFVSVSSFNTSANFTFAAWVKLNTTTGSTQYIASTANNAFSLYVDSNGNLTAKGAGSTLVADSTALTAGQWYFVAVSYDGSTLRLYHNKPNSLNSVDLVASAAVSSSFGNTTLYMGDNLGASSSLNGSIDEARYYTSVLTGPVGGAVIFERSSQLSRLYAGFGPIIDGISPGWYGQTNGNSTPLKASFAYSFSDTSTTDGNLWFNWTAVVYQTNPANRTIPTANWTNNNSNGSLPLSTTANWTAAGYYLMQLTVTDLSGKGASTYVYLPVTVVQTPTTPTTTITPGPNVNLGAGANVTLTPFESTKDQFGANLTSGTWTWTHTTPAQGNLSPANGTAGNNTPTTYTSTNGLSDTVNLQYHDTWTFSAGTVTVANVTINGLGAPGNLTATGNSTSILLNWVDNSSTETGFHIYQSTDGINFNNIADVGANVTTFTDSASTDGNFTLGTLYYYEVTAFNSSSESDPSNIVSATAGFPNAPVITSAIPGSSDFSVALTWTESTSGSINYNIQRSTTGTGNWTQVASGVTTTSWTDNATNDPANAPLSNTNYYYAANAYFTTSPTNLSAWSSNANALTIPATPAATATANATAQSIALSWTESGNTTGLTYYIQRSPNGNTGWTDLANTANLTYNDPNLTPSTYYYYRVNGHNNTGNSTWSTTTNALTIPAAPTALTAASNTANITLNWTPPSSGNLSNITGYHVYRSASANGTFTLIGNATTNGGNTTTYADTNPGNGTPWYYEVTAYNTNNGESASGAYLASGCYAATVIASDEFSYAVSGNGTTINGQNSGVGFGNWSLSNTTNSSILSGSLTLPPQGGHSLTVAGNQLQLGQGATATQTTSTTLLSSGILWVGFEFKTYNTSGSILSAEVDIGTTNNYLRIGSPYNGNIDAVAYINNANVYIPGTTAVQANQTYFVAYSIQYYSTGDVIKMYVNPTPGSTTPTSDNGNVTLTTGNLSPTSTIILKHAQSGSVPTFDELRIGATYASVAPDPIVDLPSSVSAPRSLPAPSIRSLPGDILTNSDPRITFSPILAAPTLRTVPLASQGTLSDQTYHTYAGSDPTPTSTAFTLDSPDVLLLAV